MKLHYNITQSEYEIESPLEWTTPDERGVWFVMSHKRYDLPNELGVDFGSYENWQELAEAEAKAMQVYKFVRWYEHGGIAVSLTDEPNSSDWDAGIVGVIIGNSLEDIEGEFATWKCYIEGDIWNVSILDENGEYIDGCSGFYGYQYATEEAERMLKDAQAEQDEQNSRERQAQKELKQAKTLAKKHGYILAKEV